MTLDGVIRFAFAHPIAATVLVLVVLSGAATVTQVLVSAWVSTRVAARRHRQRYERAVKDTDTLRDKIMRGEG